MKLALVTPWFGRELHGGAERLAVDLADAFANRGHTVQVFTTCSRDWSDPWDRNTLPPGRANDGLIRVERFRVDKTNTGAFREINRAILGIPRSRLIPGLNAADEPTEAAYVAQNITSTALLSELAQSATSFDRIIFLPYLYGTTLRGWHIPRERAAIVPCLHDEAYAYLGPVGAMMRGAPRLLFNSTGEYELARKLYGPSIDRRSFVVGSAIDPPRHSKSCEPIHGFQPKNARYVLFLGRNKAEKNTDLLIDAFRRFRALKPDSDLQLILAGEETNLIDEPAIRGLGAVSEDEKALLLSSACAIAQPSANESYSRVLAEAWSYGRPAIVHGDCLATTVPMRATGAGWVASTVAEWQRVLHAVDLTPAQALSQVGNRATEWVERNATWPAVIASYERALAPPPPIAEPPATPIAHVVEHASYGDSRTNTMLRINENLRARGYQSMAYANTRDPRLGGLVRQSSEMPEDSIRIEYRNDAVEISNTHVALSELAAFDSDFWNAAPDQSLITSLRGGTLILGVSPVEPGSRLVELLETFGNYLTLDFEARLAIVGPFTDSAYEERVRGSIERLRLENRVFLPGIVSTPALAAFYRSATIFVCNRERVTTGQSIIDAMAFDLPVCCTANDSSRALLQRAGLLVNTTSPIELAALWRVLVEDADTRAILIAGQRRRLATFSIDASLQIIERAIGAAH